MCVFVYVSVCMNVSVCMHVLNTEVSTVILKHHKHPSYPAILKRWFLFMGFSFPSICTLKGRLTGSLNNGKWKSLCLDAG